MMPFDARRGLTVVLIALALPIAAAHAAAGDRTYYRIGGGAPVSASAGAGHQPGQIGLGVHWRTGSSCSGLNPLKTVSNQLNGSTAGFHNLMGSIVQNAQGAVAALPAKIIQQAAPGLYDLLSKGVLQGKLKFNKAKTSCQAMSKKAAQVITSGGWHQQAQAENWSKQAHNGSASVDAVRAQEKVEAQGGDKGVTWVGGQKAGGANQQPIRVTRDTVIAGYNHLYGRPNATSTAPVSGGGGGWGSIPGVTGGWPGAGSGSNNNNPACRGGMCTVWGSPNDAANWIDDVVGTRTIRTCSGCDKIDTSAGVGLAQKLRQSQKTIETKLDQLVASNGAITSAQLRAVSAGPGISVSKGVIDALRHDPQSGMLTHRLAGEMALARTLTQALWARRTLLAGANAPGIANNQQGQHAIDGEVRQLDRGIQGLKTQMDVRKSLAHSAATVALQRSAARAANGAPAEQHKPKARINIDPQLPIQPPNGQGNGGP